MESLSIPTQPFFIVGTPQEAARVEAAGYIAIVAGDYDPANVALSMQGTRNAGTAILALNGQASSEWSGALEAAGVPSAHVRHDEYRDALTLYEDDGRLRELLWREYQSAAANMELSRAEARARRLKSLHVHDSTDVAMQLYNLDVTREHVPTGLSGLDKALGGGLPEGSLTVLGAGSSSGKTSLCNQIADHIAASGRHVLFVTVEQSRHELVAKSLSRAMRLTRKHSGGYYVASASHIMSNEERSKWPQDKTAALLRCASDYSASVAPYMHYFESDGQPSVKEIRAAYLALCENGQPTPCLFVDYLQLLAAKDERMTDRKAVDVNVMELRQLAREMNTAVVVISSINRQSYDEGADMGAFKESGTIEFSADVALMLQPRGFGEATKAKTDKEARQLARDAMTEHKSTVSRQSEVVVLKNRGGGIPKDPVPLDFDALSGLFTDTEAGASRSTGGVLSGFE